MKTIFDMMMDSLQDQLQVRMAGLLDTAKLFGFLLPAELATMTREDLRKKCAQLARKYKDDLSETLLFEELSVFVSSFVADLPKTGSFTAVIEYLLKHGVSDAFPSIVTACKLGALMPVSVAENERSFSKLKLIKTAQRTSMGEERLSDLAVLSVEGKLAQTVDYSDVIKQMAYKKR